MSYAEKKFVYEVDSNGDLLRYIGGELDGQTKPPVEVLFYVGSDPAGNNAEKVVLSQPTDIFTSGRHLTGATTDSAAMLWNPLSSGVNLKISYAAYKVATAGLINIYTATTTLGTDSTAWSGNINTGGSAPLGEYKTSQDAAIADSDIIGSGYGLGNTVVPASELVGATITPGNGLVMECSNNSAFLGTFQWYEESV